MTVRVEKLERKVKELEIEWEGWYDKYRRLYARLSKREERAHAAPDEPVETARGGGSPHITNPAALRLLGRL